MFVPSVVDLPEPFLGLALLPLADQPSASSGHLPMWSLLSFDLSDHVSTPPALLLLLRVLGRQAVLLLASSEQVWFCTL